MAECGNRPKDCIARKLRGVDVLAVEFGDCPAGRRMATAAPVKKASGAQSERPVISSERRAAIWDHLRDVMTRPSFYGKWWTREEVLKAAGAAKGPACTADDLWEVMRGKKHKEALGVESKKVKGHWMHRFTDPDGLQSTSSKMSLASPTKASAPNKASSASKRKKPASPASKPKKSSVASKARAKPAPKRSTPLRPRAKTAHTPATLSSPVASRKRRSEEMTTPVDSSVTTPSRRSSASNKKRRVSFSEPIATPAVKELAGGDAGVSEDGSGSAATHARGDTGGGWCVVM